MLVGSDEVVVMGVDEVRGSDVEGGDFPLEELGSGRVTWKTFFLAFSFISFVFSPVTFILLAGFVPRWEVGEEMSKSESRSESSVL